jgi:arylsulfatase
MPDVHKGAKQLPLAGVSMRYSFDAKPDGKTQKKRQYYAMLGTRGIWEDGWRASTVHAPLSSKGNFDKDRWELYHVDEDRSESTDLAKEHPEKLQALIDAWFEEADRNMVLPLDDRSARELLTTERPTGEALRDRYIYYPDTAAVPESAAVNVRGRSFKILADIEITDPSCSGVIFAHGSRFGGHALFMKDGKLWYVYNFLGIAPEQKMVSPEPLEPGKHTVGMEFTRTGEGKQKEATGPAKLYVDDKVVDEAQIRTQVGKFTIAGDGLCIGRDSEDAVSKEYQSPAKFKGGKIQFVAVSIEKTQYVVLERLAAAAFAAD